VDEALNLVMSAYKEERNTISFLPKGEEYLQLLKERMENLFTKGTGFVAIDNYQLKGFICGFKQAEMFGSCKGIYIPLYGHGTDVENSRKIYEGLYQYAAENWVKEEYLTHAITVFSDIKETIDTWFWMGFGLRCIDAIRKVNPIEVINSSITIHKAEMQDIAGLAEIHGKHNLYYRQSPIFMPRHERDPVEDLTNWLREDNHHMWIVYKGSEPLGYMGIEPVAETFISEHKDIMNITSGYVVENSRQSSVGSTILDSVQKWLLENDYSLCGVDFESINTIGSNFWTKYFTPYTYSLVRRIDERIL